MVPIISSRIGTRPRHQSYLKLKEEPLKRSQRAFGKCVKVVIFMLRLFPDTSKVLILSIYFDHLAPLSDADVDIMPQRNHYWNAGISAYKFSVNI